MTDEFLAHHCEAAFQIMMRSLFPIEPEEQTIENNSVESCGNERNIFRLHAGELPIVIMMSPAGFSKELEFLSVHP